MKKVNFLFLCCFLMLLAYSCNLESDNSVKIQVINQTNEDIIIYKYTIFKTKMTEAIIPCDKTRFIWVEPGTTYYARGESSNKEYGEGKFVKVPSRYDPQQTWTIK